MKCHNALLATVGLFVAAVPAAGYSAVPLGISAKLFGARPSAMAPDLSPNGDKIVYIEALQGRANAVAVVDLKTKKTTEVIASTGKTDSIGSCEFASEEWVVCDDLSDIPFRAWVIGSQRLVAVNINTKQTKNLGVDSDVNDAATIKQSDGYVISYPASNDASVILGRYYVRRAGEEDAMGSEGPPVSLGIDRISLASMKTTHIVAPDPLVDSLLTSPDGIPRVMSRADYDGHGHPTGLEHFTFRPAGSNNWLELGAYDERSETGIEPIDFDSTTNTLYILKKKDGREALYSRKLDAEAPLVEVATNPTYDIQGVIRMQRGGPVIGYEYVADRSQVVYFDPSYNRVIDDLSKALPGTPLIDIASVSRDGSKFLIYASSDNDPGAYYVYDKNTRSLDFALENRDALANMPLAAVKRVDVPTRDGKSIPAYLTMPAGHAPNGPAIVLPHGGPSSRDTLGFDWLPQFLASRGYAVIQPNYRGSAGYGDQFKGDNAFKNWKLVMSDIGASADYLVKQGIASPSRLAIVGWSYGGYAALQSAVTEPDRYKAVIAVAPVTDLPKLDDRDFSVTNASLMKDLMGKRQNLRDGSPALHAQMIKAPVLLVHGDLDRNVAIAQSEEMAKAIKSAGGTVDFLQFKGLNHQLEDGDARTQMLTKIGELLDRTIGH